jgi:transcriptional regulator with XRE-family HTH domain
MQHQQIIDTIQNLTNKKPKQREIAEALGVEIGVIGKRATRNSNYTVEEIQKLSEYFKCDILGLSKELILNCLDKIDNISDNNSVEVLFRPDVFLSAGYGIQVYNEDADYMVLDKRLFFTDRGTKINPKNCEIVTISGNSMAPEYRHGDRVIIDKSITQFIDGHIFAFRYNGECFIKEICILGKKIKAIPLNKEYEPFYIEPDDDVKIFGRIIPRVRL